MNSGVYLRPIAIIGPPPSPEFALPLAGGPLAFLACEVLRRDRPRQALAVSALVGWAESVGLAEPVAAWLSRLTVPRPAFAGLDLDRPRVMGVINVTPDSFSDGGDRFDQGRAVADGLAMLEAGAAILDVGGESTRPGAEPVDEDEERSRVVPVVRRLCAQGALVSIDSRRPVVMAAALDAGARVINDVTALSGDPDSLPLAARSGAAVVLMHMRGDPRTMQREPRYRDVALDVYDYLAERVAACEAAGIGRERLAVDPGIGFGKSVQHNLDLLDRLGLFHGLGCALMLGVSRKSFIGRLSRGEPPKERLAGSLVAALAGAERGAQLLRVHDVAETVQALKVWRAIGHRTAEAAATASAPLQAPPSRPAAS